MARTTMKGLIVLWLLLGLAGSLWAQKPSRLPTLSPDPLKRYDYTLVMTTRGLNKVAELMTGLLEKHQQAKKKDPEKRRAARERAQEKGELKDFSIFMHPDRSVTVRGSANVSVVGHVWFDATGRLELAAINEVSFVIEKLKIREYGTKTVPLAQFPLDASELPSGFSTSIDRKMIPGRSATERELKRRGLKPAPGVTAMSLATYQHGSTVYQQLSLEFATEEQAEAYEDAYYVMDKTALVVTGFDGSALSSLKKAVKARAQERRQAANANIIKNLKVQVARTLVVNLLNLAFTERKITDFLDIEAKGFYPGSGFVHIFTGGKRRLVFKLKPNALPTKVLRHLNMVHAEGEGDRIIVQGVLKD